MAIIQIDSANCIPEITKIPKTMLTVEIVDGVTHVRCNSSSLSIIQQCPRKAYYSLHRGLTSKNESPATLFGSAIHAAMEVFYSAPSEQRIIPPNMIKNLELMSHGGALESEESYLVFRATKAFINRAAPLSSLPAEDKRSIPNGVWILGHYYETWINDPWTVCMDENGPIVERTLEAVIHEEPGLKITAFGTVDVALQNKANGNVLLCDHKTSSVVGKDFYSRLKPNSQYSFYVWLAQQCLAIDTEDFMVNCIEVKPKPKTVRGSKPNFPRQITRRSVEDLQEFKSTLIHYIKQYLLWNSDKFWPLGQVDACATYGGCQYLNVCSSPASIRENIINADYIGDRHNG